MTTKVPVELSSTPGIVDGSNATAITIDSSENVAIGRTSSIAHPLDIQKADDAYIRISSGTTQENAGILFANQNTTKWTLEKEGSAHSLFLKDASSTAVTFVQGGYVGIGTTSVSYPLTVNKDVDDYVAKIENDGNSTSSNGLWVDTRWNTATNIVFKVTTNSGNTDVIVAKGDGKCGINQNNPTETLHVTGSAVLFDTASGDTGNVIGGGTAVDDQLLSISGLNNSCVTFHSAGTTGFNTAACAIKVTRNGSNSRSINASGTINASGADYAEYMKKSDGCGTINKGDVCGVDVTGKLTDVFSDSKSFVIKSTNPSYVGADNWGSKDLELSEEELEAERQKYDRIAFSGQVPVNITGSFNVGDYVYPQANGANIGAVAKSNPTFEEYRLCVGKIWATEDDGRPLVAVKIG